MKKQLLFYPLMGMLTTLFACSDTDAGVKDVDNHELTAVFSLEVEDFDSFAQSRGQWSAHEDAVGNEGKIYDAVIIITDQSMLVEEKSDLKDASATPVFVTPVSSMTAQAGGTYYTGKFAMPPMEAGTYYAIAMCNLNISPLPNFGSMSLAQILDYVYSGALCTGAEDISGGGVMTSADHFVMGPVGECKFSVAENQTADINITNTTCYFNPNKLGNTYKSDSDYRLEYTGQPLKVRRLAARVELSVGADAVDNTLGGIDIPVYDYAFYTATPSQLVLTGDTYTLTDVDLLDVATDNEYMIFRTSQGYFKDEGSKRVNTDGVKGYYAENQSTTPSLTLAVKDLSLVKMLKDGNVLYQDENDVKYYTLAYLRENSANSSSTDGRLNKTKIKLTGSYYKYSDLDQEYGKTYTLAIETPLRHCLIDAGNKPEETRSMAFGVGRNSIYRVKIDKIFSDGERVYVKWYFDSDNNGSYDDVSLSSLTPFYGYIVDDNSVTTPND